MILVDIKKTVNQIIYVIVREIYMILIHAFIILFLVPIFSFAIFSDPILIVSQRVIQSLYMHIKTYLIQHILIFETAMP